MTAFHRPLVLKAAGTALVAVGGLLMLTTVGYVGVGLYGESRLDELVVAEDEAPQALDDLRTDLFVPGLEVDANTGPSSATPSIDSTSQPPPLTADATGETPSAVTPTDSADTDTGSSETAADAASGRTSEVGDGPPPEARPDGLSPAPVGERFEFGLLRTEAAGSSTGSAIGARFEPVDWSTLPLSIGERPRAHRMIIPAIGLDSAVVELGTRWDGPNLQWETADHAVGHHLGTPHPSELGNAVFSGHINSPFRGEGSIFRRLPEVASLLREGRTVDIVVESERGRYLYRATSTDVVLPEEVEVFTPERTPGLTLVTCVPATHYTHRFLVNAVLVGQAPPRA